jgi:hypothetical protein
MKLPNALLVDAYAARAAASSAGPPPLRRFPPAFAAVLSASITFVSVAAYFFIQLARMAFAAALSPRAFAASKSA